MTKGSKADILSKLSGKDGEKRQQAPKKKTEKFLKKVLTKQVSDDILNKLSTRAKGAEKYRKASGKQRKTTLKRGGG